MEGSILDTLGAELMGILVPVSACMLLVVLLVHSLTPHGTDSAVPSIATLFYTEKTSDTTSQKLEGALLNSLVFILVVTVSTFLLVLLYYYRCVKFLKYYMCFSASTVLSYIGGAVFFQLVQSLSIPLDIGSFGIFLYNFSVVGVLSVFLSTMPILVTQFYLVMIGMLVAFWFTRLPEWTTWILLVAMALYDLVAVLAPKGPLNLLVELAISRDEEIPALIYEARPVTRTSSAHTPLATDDSAFGEEATSSLRPRRWRTHTVHAGGVENNNASTEMQSWNENINGNASNTGENRDVEMQVTSVGRASSPDSEHVHGGAEDNVLGGLENEQNNENDELRPLVSPMPVRSGHSHNDVSPGGDDTEDLIVGLSSSGALKLGLGDFVFYSLLVGRAAMYDLMTVYACYLAIIAGLGSTLILLAVARRALPALPISIGLGVIFYFLTRLLMEPFVAGLSTTLVMF